MDNLEYKNVAHNHLTTIKISEPLRSTTFKVNHVPSDRNVMELLRLVSLAEHNNKAIFSETQPLEILRSIVTKQASGLTRLRITLPALLATRRGCHKNLTTSSGKMLTITQDLGFAKGASLEM